MPDTQSRQPVDSEETLKPLADLESADFRNTIWGYHNPNTGESRQQGAQDLHHNAAHAKVADHVPSKIRSHFAMAQNLAVYAWYYYPFHMAAQLHAFASLEFALREVLKPASRQEGTFFAMLTRAASEHWVTDSGFVLHTLPKAQGGKYLALVKVKDADGVRRRKEQWFDHWVETLPHYLPDRRNDLAHGSNALWEDPSVLWVCADLINQLYQPSRPTSTATREVTT